MWFSVLSLPGSILARVNKVESLATKQEVKSNAASFWCRSASSCSSSTWNLLVPEMFLVPPAPEPCFRKVSLETQHKIKVWTSSSVTKEMFLSFITKGKGMKCLRECKKKQKKTTTVYTHNGLYDSWVAAHAKVVVATPDRHLPLVVQGGREVVSHGEFAGQAIHRFKHAVSVIALLFNNLLLQEIIILEARHCQRGSRQSWLNWMKQQPNRWNLQFCL